MSKNIKHIVCPPAYEPTEQEHMIAYLKHVLESISYDYLLGIKMYKDDLKKGILSYKAGKKIENEDELKQIIEDDTNYFIDKYFEKWGNDEDKEIWEKFIDYEDFKRTWGKEFLTEPHFGDCNAHACSCMRCHADEKYGQDTVTWANKYEGHELYGKYIQELDKEK